MDDGSCARDKPETYNLLMCQAQTHGSYVTYTMLFVSPRSTKQQKKNVGLHKKNFFALAHINRLMPFKNLHFFQ